MSAKLRQIKETSVRCDRVNGQLHFDLITEVIECWNVVVTLDST